jgi:predicted RNA binding protein YcfA (HicA-like mRNA interferase family)
MGALGGFRYREIAKRLKHLGLVVHRQAAGSHEIWFNPALDRYTTIPNHTGDMPEATLRAILKQAGIDAEMTRTPERPFHNRTNPTSA